MSIVPRIQNILMSPKTEWPVIAVEGASVNSLYMGYIIPLAAIPAICTFISFSFFLPFGLTYGLIWAILSYGLGLVATYIMAFIAAKLAPSFNGRDDLIQGLKLIAYAYTASWVGGIFTLIPFVGWIGTLAAGIYGLYLLYLGTSPVMGVPADKSVIYTIVLIVVAIIVIGIIGAVVGAVVTSVVGVGMIGAMH
jgi:hypothetical protein